MALIAGFASSHRGKCMQFLWELAKPAIERIALAHQTPLLTNARNSFLATFAEGFNGSAGMNRTQRGTL